MTKESFVWGAASSAYQTEGFSTLSGGGVSVWDTFCHTPGKIAFDDNADIACDGFHRYREDLELLKATGASVILITSEPCDEALAAQADVLLPCHVENNGIKNTYLAPMCLADYFCNALGQTKTAEGRIDQIEALLRDTAVLGE